MKTLISFTIAMVAWVLYEASATETSCTIGSHGSIFLPHQHHALIGHSFLNQSGTVRIQCMMLCFRHSRCLSFNHGDISGICQLNDASKEDFPDTYKQVDGFSYFGGSSNKAKSLPEEAMITTKTEQQANTTPTKQITTVSLEPSTLIPETTPEKAVVPEGPRVNCPQGGFGLTNDGNARTSVQWLVYSYRKDGKSLYEITCTDDDEGRTVVSGDYFKAGTTPVTCRAWDEAGNPGQCSFLVNITVCNIIPLGMESGDIADNQITAETVRNNDYGNYGPAHARLNSLSSWCGQSHFTYIQVNFDHLVDIYGLIIQGRYGSGERVTHLGLKYNEGGRAYTFMSDASSSSKDYIAIMMHGIQNVIVPVQTPTQTMIRSSSIRIHPFRGGDYPCMRFELLGCKKN